MYGSVKIGVHTYMNIRIVKWWLLKDSNLEPPLCKGGCLAVDVRNHMVVPEGTAPSYTEYKSAVLLLNYGTIWWLMKDSNLHLGLRTPLF